MYDVNFPTPEIRFVVGGSEGLLRVLTGKDKVPDCDLEGVIATCFRELSKWLSAVAGEFKPRSGKPVTWKGVCRSNAALVLSVYVDGLLRRAESGIPIEFLSQTDADELFAQIQAEGIDAEHARGNSTEIPYCNNNGELISRFDQKPISVASNTPCVASGHSPTNTPESNDEPIQYVTLLQISALVNKSKRTLERKIDSLPPPDVVGGDGIAHEWVYEKVKPAIESLYPRKLPDKFPADRFQKR